MSLKILFSKRFNIKYIITRLYKPDNKWRPRASLVGYYPIRNTGEAHSYMYTWTENDQGYSHISRIEREKLNKCFR